MSDEYRPFKRGRSHDDEEEAGRHAVRDFDDPYVRDENGRPVGFKKGSGSVVRRRLQPEGPPLKPYLILSGVFGALLLASGQFLFAGVVVAVTALVYAFSRMRR